MKTLILIGVLALSACATPEQRAESAISRHGPYCERLGFAADTDAWRQCIQSAVAERTQTRRNSIQAYEATRKATSQ